MKKVIVYLLIVLLLLSFSCSIAPSPAPTPVPTPKPVPVPAPAPAPTPVPMPTPVLTNSESDSRVAELEAKIRQLEAENQRLLTENRRLETENQRVMSEYRQLSSDLARVTSVLQNLYSLATSSSYTNTLSKLNEIQNNTSDLVTWVGGLPSLPPLPLGITISEIEDVINKARYLREILQRLPPPPFFAPPEWRELDDMKNELIRMTEWMENLQDLPEFLASAEELEDLRFRLESYMGDVDSTAFDARRLLEEVRDVASP